MIDIQTDRDRDLKNIRQMGAPTEDNKIYIENAAYARIHEEEYGTQRVFVFMGHTECTKGRYTTFVEAAIPVRNLEFSQNVPAWNTHAWSDIFREIKRSYENSIIVGWAMDIKGFPPRMTPALEAIHKEQFGGAHQLLFLMDTAEGEEYFYQNRGSHLQKKDGFYIYYTRELHRVRPAEVTVEVPPRDALQTLPEPQKKTREHKATSYAMVAAVALLVVIVGVGAIQNQLPIIGVKKIISTMSEKFSSKNEAAEVLVGTQWQQQDTENATESVTETVTETLDLIPIEELPSDSVAPLEESAQTGTSKASENAAGTTDASENTTDAAGTTGTSDTAANTAGTSDTSDTAANTTASASASYYTVQKGDTLTGICKKYYGSIGKLTELAAANQLDNVDDIREGQKLLLP